MSENNSTTNWYSPAEEAERIRRAKSNLAKVKLTEKEKLAKGYYWITEGKTSRLVPPNETEQERIKRLTPININKGGKSNQPKKSKS